MKIKMLITLAVIALVALFYNREALQAKHSKTTLPNKYQHYAALASGDVESENYRLVQKIKQSIEHKSFRGRVYVKDIFYDNVRNTYLLISEYAYSVEGLGTIKRPLFWKLDESGEILDSAMLDFNGRLLNSGVLFEDNHFVDWINTGNSAKQKYTAILKEENLTATDLDNYFAQATLIDIGTGSAEETVNIYLQINGGWTIVQSKNFHKNIKVPEAKYETTYRAELSPYTDNYPTRFTALENAIKPFYNWSQPNQGLYLEHFEKRAKVKTTPFAVNGGNNSGWNGMGYFELNHHSQPLNFALPTFKNADSGFGYDPNMRLFRPLNKDSKLLFLNVYNKRLNEASGLYVVEAKN